jgi:hypothetical protein
MKRYPCSMLLSILTTTHRKDELAMPEQLQAKQNSASFEVITAMLFTIPVLQNVTLHRCDSGSRRFEGTYCLHSYGSNRPNLINPIDP